MTPVIETAVAVINRLDLAIIGRATIVLAVGLIALILAGRARASLRHLLMASTFGALIVLPVAVSTPPPVTIRSPAYAPATVGHLISNPVPGAVVAAKTVDSRDHQSNLSRSLVPVATQIGRAHA